MEFCVIYIKGGLRSLPQEDDSAMCLRLGSWPSMALIESIDRKSPQVGRAHGIYINTALDGSDHFLMSLVFTKKEYNGSTLEIQGADRFFQKYREVSVVSRTGMFRLARGYAILETVMLDLPGSNAIVRWNVTVLHY